MEESLKKHRDLKNVMDTRERLGFEKGVEKRQLAYLKKELMSRSFQK